jgi:hypothetical protein
MMRAVACFSWLVVPGAVSGTPVLRDGGMTSSASRGWLMTAPGWMRPGAKASDNAKVTQAVEALF